MSRAATLVVAAAALLASTPGATAVRARLSPPATLPDTLATLLLENGRFWTGDSSMPWTDAVAIHGDRIVAVGADAVGRIGARGKRLDLGGRLGVPGFIDNHTHMRDGSLSLAAVQLRDARTPAEFIRRIKEHAASLPAGAWVLGGNWDHENWGGELPTRAWIDSVSDGHPVFVNRLDGHMALANTATLRIAGIDRRTPDPAGGAVVRDASGDPTGILKDTAKEPVWPHVPDPTEAQLLEAFEAGLAYARSQGVTSVQDMCYPADPRIVRRLLATGRLTLRFYCRLPLERTRDLAAVGVGAGFGGAWLKLGSVKAYVDGSLGSSTAAFFEPYDDDPANRGLEMYDADSLYRALSAADRAGIQLSVHAIGDRAISDLLDAFARIRDENPAWDRRWRIEHAQHIAPKDFPRFRSLAVIASMQPYHAIDDGRWAEKRIGAERARTTYAFRTLLDDGVTLTFGSDWDVAPLSPIQGIYAAVTRRTLDGAHPEGWVPEQKITVEEALRAYTVAAAYSAFEENEKGRIAPGLLADLAVLDRDLFRIPPEEIADARVVMTIVGGEVVYDAGGPR